MTGPRELYANNDNDNDDDDNNKYAMSFAGNSIEAASMAHTDSPLRPITVDDLVRCILFVLFRSRLLNAHFCLPLDKHSVVCVERSCRTDSKFGR